MKPTKKYAFYWNYQAKLFVATDPTKIKFRHRPEAQDDVAYVPVLDTVNTTTTFTLTREELHEYVRALELLTNSNTVYFTEVQEDGHLGQLYTVVPDRSTYI